MLCFSKAPPSFQPSVQATIRDSLHPLYAQLSRLIIQIDPIPSHTPRITVISLLLRIAIIERQPAVFVTSLGGKAAPEASDATG